MVWPLIYGGMVLGGLWLGKEALDEAGQAAESSAKLVKWGVAAGALYVSYSALKASGALK